MSKQDVFNNRDDFSDLMNPIKVLLVEQKNGRVAYIIHLLHCSFFEVTHVDQSFEAIRLLSEKKSEYDLLLINHDMSDVDIHTFLNQTKDMGVLSYVMSGQEDDAFVLEVFKSGAFLVLKTPLTIDALRCIRQDVIRERMNKQGKCENKNMTHKSVTPGIDIEEKSSSSNFDNNLVMESSLDNGNDGLKKRIWLKWTPELCEKFDNALTQLGEERCYPTEIHKLMNVPGQTKRQVASHLQQQVVSEQYGKKILTKKNAIKNGRPEELESRRVDHEHESDANFNEGLKGYDETEDKFADLTIDDDDEGKWLKTIIQEEKRDDEIRKAQIYDVIDKCKEKVVSEHWLEEDRIKGAVFIKRKRKNRACREIFEKEKKREGNLTKIRKSKAKQTTPTSLPNLSFSSNLSAQELNLRKYESMSHIETSEANQEGASDLIGINQTNIGSSLMSGSSPKNISQATPFTYGNGLGSNQHESFSGGITATIDFPHATFGTHDAGQGLDYHPFSSDQKQAYDDFLIYMDGNGLNRDLISESFSFSHDHVMQNEDNTGLRSTSKS
ncbi:hypothetical protein L1987_39624 [Smallanthus sonchifolius]|uniref:Uncharacterized protein n=1 Tax=Smallanthus sonchifolius TaxID=185202 RepID=A0ACB9HMT2_9ASTR|nr:hypothetical protein L1987_39624 [Smallanthus sonchifolius]